MVYNCDTITSSSKPQSLKHGLDAYFSYPDLANELRATLLSVSMSSMSASNSSLTLIFGNCSVDDRLASGNVIKFGTDISQYQCLQFAPIKVGIELVHDVDFLDGNV